MILRPVQQSAAVVSEWLADGRRVVAGTLVAVDGSAPLDVGASVYVEEGGILEGSVTGGCVEGAVAQEALDMLANGLPARLATYGISDDLAGTVGLMCGGTVHIFIHEIRPDARDGGAGRAGRAARRAARRGRDAARRRRRRAQAVRGRRTDASAGSAARRCSTTTSSARRAG